VTMASFPSSKFQTNSTPTNICKWPHQEQYVKVIDLKPYMKNLNCVFIVLEKGPVIRTKDNHTLAHALVADGSASIQFFLWDTDAEWLKPGDILQLHGGYCTLFKVFIDYFAFHLHVSNSSVCFLSQESIVSIFRSSWVRKENWRIHNAFLRKAKHEQSPMDTRSERRKNFGDLILIRYIVRFYFVNYLCFSFLYY